jgi:hypothetical protein
LGMHHMSLRHGLRWFSAGRRRTVSRDSSWWSVSLTMAPASNSKVQREWPSGGFAQAVATRSASSLAESFRSAPGRGSSLSAANRGERRAANEAGVRRSQMDWFDRCVGASHVRMILRSHGSSTYRHAPDGSAAATGAAKAASSMDRLARVREAGNRPVRLLLIVTRIVRLIRSDLRRYKRDGYVERPRDDRY